MLIVALRTWLRSRGRCASAFSRIPNPESPIPASSQAARGVDDVRAVEARGARAVRNRRHLAWLALAVEERTAETVVRLVADRGAGVPELRRADLVRDILDHRADLAVLDFVEQLAAKLRVVALLVDRE